VVKASVEPKITTNNAETFVININNLTNDSATLDINWAQTLVSLKFEVPTQKTAMASIEKALAGPTAGDYYSAGQYYFQSNGDLSKALEYVNKALNMVKAGEEVPFWQLRMKSLIQAKLGDKKGAIETAKVSLAAAEKAKNEDYVKMNNDSIKEWSKNNFLFYCPKTTKSNNVFVVFLLKVILNFQLIFLYLLLYHIL